MRDQLVNLALNKYALGQTYKLKLYELKFNNYVGWNLSYNEHVHLMDYFYIEYMHLIIWKL